MPYPSGIFCISTPDGVLPSLQCLQVAHMGGKPLRPHDCSAVVFGCPCQHRQLCLWSPQGIATAVQHVQSTGWVLLVPSCAVSMSEFPLCCTGALTDYRITVYTSPFASAATDACVTAVLYGSTAIGHRMQLNPVPRGTAFTQGAVDAFTLESQQLGQLWKLHIGHDGKVSVQNRERYRKLTTMQLGAAVVGQSCHDGKVGS